MAVFVKFEENDITYDDTLPKYFNIISYLILFTSWPEIRIEEFRDDRILNFCLLTNFRN